MKKFYSLMLLIITLTAFTSCQKEIVLDDPSTDNTGGGGVPPSTNGDLLIKMYGKIGNGADSNVTYYSYNAAKQLITRRVITNTNSGLNNYDAYIRNAAGLIVRRKQYFVSGAIPIQADTTVTNYYYNTAAIPQIQYSVSSTIFLGLTVNDSSVYSYTASGKFTKMESYQSDFLSGMYAPSTRTIFSLDAAGNCTKLDLYNMNAGTANLVSTQLFTYDNKVPSQTFTEAESVVINSEPAFIHNATRLQVNNFVAGASNLTTNFTISYNSANKPATTKEVMQLNGTTTTTNYTFYYQ